MLPNSAVAERQSTYSSKDVRGPERGHHFLHIDDFSRDELMAMLKTSAEVKSKLLDRDEAYKPFAGKTMSMIFTKPSMRTRLSFETVSNRDSSCIEHDSSCEAVGGSHIWTHMRIPCRGFSGWAAMQYTWAQTQLALADEKPPRT